MFERWRERRRFSRLVKTDPEAALRQVAEERAARRKAARTPLELLDPMTRELIQIGRDQGYLDRENGGRERTRKIGQRLYDLGGDAAMLAAHTEVDHWLPFESRSLDMAWDGIGDWRG